MVFLCLSKHLDETHHIILLKHIMCYSRSLPLLYTWIYVLNFQKQKYNCECLVCVCVCVCVWECTEMEMNWTLSQSQYFVLGITLVICFSEPAPWLTVCCHPTPSILFEWIEMYVSGPWGSSDWGCKSVQAVLPIHLPSISALAALQHPRWWRQHPQVVPRALLLRVSRDRVPIPLALLQVQHPKVGLEHSIHDYQYEN